MRELAPIVLFVYNRPWHTLQTLEALSENTLAKESVLYVYSDGPKENAGTEQLGRIEEVRKVLRSKQWCKDVVIHESAQNKGLANSIIEGVTAIVNRHGRVIVLEDDLLTSKYFLKYMNDGLEAYDKACNVYAINSYMFPIDVDKATTFLSPLATSTWGWATWADKWKAFEVVPRYKHFIQDNPFLRSRFNLADYDYAGMLDNTDSWGIRWYYSVFIRNGLGVFPTKSLVQNIGFGEDASHTKVEFKQASIYNSVLDVVLKDQIDFEMHGKLLQRFANTVVKHSILKRILRRIISFLNE